METKEEKQERLYDWIRHMDEDALDELIGEFL